MNIFFQISFLPQMQMSTLLLLSLTTSLFTLSLKDQLIYYVGPSPTCYLHNIIPASKARGSLFKMEQKDYKSERKRIFSVRVVAPRKVRGYTHEVSSVWLLKQD